MKKLITICAAALATAALAADTDVGAIVTDKNVEDVAKVENLTGANAGKATVTIKDNSGTANAVTVYNAATMDTALAGKAATGDVTALETRATALETATNGISSALATHTAASNNPHGVTCAQIGAVAANDGTATSLTVYDLPNDPDYPALRLNSHRQGSFGMHLMWHEGSWRILQLPGDDEYFIAIPHDKPGTMALTSDIPTSWPYTAITNAPWIATESDPTVPSWAKAAAKPSYNFSEIGSKPTTLSGYGITDANIANGTITLGSASITPLTSYTETDPTALKPSQLKVNGTAMTTASAAVELGGYYIKTVDGKPHLFLRGN